VIIFKATIIAFFGL